jgi:hypothetical protein
VAALIPGSPAAFLPSVREGFPMSRFNTKNAAASGTSPITSTGRTTTSEGGTGYLRDARSELFLLAVSNFVATDTFYEKGGDRDDRYTQLVRELAVSDPEWAAGLLGWLRGEAHMRTASLVGAAEFTRARLDAGLPGRSRQVVDSVLQRPDEPGELLAYWTGRYGRGLPKPLKRGIADAVQRLYDSRALLAYDTDSKGYRLGDVLELVHPAPAADKPWQGDLFKHAIDRRHGRHTAIPARLGPVRAHAALMAIPVEERRAVMLGQAPTQQDNLFRASRLTWEALAGWLQGPMDAAAWESVIPTMGYTALLRNLRNFDQAGVSDEVAERVAAKLADPAEVARSRQLPMRFYSAYIAAPSLRWGWALEKALTAALVNVPSLPGRTLVLVDTSSSMNGGFSKDGTVRRWDAAALFGIALGQRCAEADVVSFSSAQFYRSDAPGAKVKDFPLTRGESLLTSVKRWKEGGWFLGGGTDTAAALRATFTGHDRVVIVTDEQAGVDPRGVSASVPESVPMYTWNLAGYRAGHAPSGGRNRHAFAGLTDQAFAMVPLLEGGANAVWPWVRRSG